MRTLLFVLAVALLPHPVSAGQNGYFWWNAEVQSADKDTTPEGPAFVLYGTQRHLRVKWVFKNDEGNASLTIIPAELQRSLRMIAIIDGRQVPTTVRWATTGKSMFSGGDAIASPEEIVVLRPDDWLEWHSSVYLEGPAPWHPGSYQVSINMAPALATISADGRPWRGRAVLEGKVLVRVTEANTATTRKAQRRLSAASLLADGRADEAVKEYRSLLATDPSENATYSGLGLALVAAGQFREGASVLERILPSTLKERNSVPETLAYAYVALNDEYNAVRVLRLIASETDVPAHLQRLRAVVRNRPRR